MYRKNKRGKNPAPLFQGNTTALRACALARIQLRACELCLVPLALRAPGTQYLRLRASPFGLALSSNSTVAEREGRLRPSLRSGLRRAWS